jgi:protocatechuate 3,4-dioxygenase beta subunit
MFSNTRLATAVALLAACTVALAAGQSQQPIREDPTQPTGSAPHTARIAGRVLDASSGQPVTRARVMLSGAEIPDGRTTLTDDAGGFDFTHLPAGRFTLTTSKAAYLTVAYGQRRPLQPGTPLQLREAEQLTRVDVALPRGSVISGTVRNENGDPMPGATLRVLLYQYVQGDRQLVPAGSAQSDDRGRYRVWGLNPGEYYLAAVAPLLRVATSASAGHAQESYAPTYYPGVASAREAQPVAVGLSVELLDLDFNVLLVPVSRIVGRVIDPQGAVSRAASVSLSLADNAGPGESRSLGARIGPDGTFTIDDIPPGRYALSARAENNGATAYATQPFETNGGDAADLTLFLASGATLSGTTVFESTGAAAVPEPGEVSIAATPTARAAFGPRGATATLEADGSFTLAGVPPGVHWIRARAPQGWVLKSVIVDGRETIDTPLEVRGNGRTAGIRMSFTDRVSEIAGTLTDERRAPVTDYTVLVFSTDEEQWRPQSRHVMTARPDQNGRFQIRGLPPGGYFLTTIDPEQPGEWYDPRFLAAQRTNALRLTLGDGERRAQDLVVAAP